MSFWSDKFKVIADRIRARLGTTDLITPNDFANKVDEVYEKGKKDEYDSFWNAIQTEGDEATSYDYKFCGYAWNDITFRPKYDIKVRYNSGVSTFQRSRITNMEQVLKDCGVVLDLSNCGNINYMFGGGAFTILPELDLRNASGLYETFNTASIHTIRKILSSKTTNWGIYAFHRNKASKLEKVVIEGVIAKTLTLQYQPLLSADSIFSFIEALCPDTDVTGVSITFNQTAVNNIPFPYTSPKTGITYTSWDDEGDATSVKSLSPSNWTISVIT